MASVPRNRDPIASSLASNLALTAALAADGDEALAARATVLGDGLGRALAGALRRGSEAMSDGESDRTEGSQRSLMELQGALALAQVPRDEAA